MRFAHGYFGWTSERSQPAAIPESGSAAGAGDIFPACQFVLLDYARDRLYLKIDHTDRLISLGDINSDYIFIELYNELCFACLNEVQNFKALYHMLNRDELARQRVRIIGVGVGSKKRTVAKFRKTKNIPFPLFADADQKLFECLGNPTLPAAYLIRMTSDGKGRIVLVQSGHIASTKKLMLEIIAEVGGKAN